VGRLWNLLLRPFQKRFERGFQTGQVVEEFVEARFGLHSVVGAATGGVLAEAVFQGLDGDGEVGGVWLLDLGLVDVDTCPCAAAIENDVVFGGGLVGVEGVEKKEEEEEGHDRDRGETFPANRGGELEWFGFGETCVGWVSEKAMFGVDVPVGGEILKGGGDSEVVLDAL